MTPREASSFVAELGATLTALASLPMPTIAAVDGVALGGGAELALACDVRVVGPGGVFAFPEARLGIIPGAGGCARLPRLVGPARALDLIATSRRVGPAEAVALGLANYEATGEDAEASTGHRGATGAADARALALARSIAGAAPLALRAAKAAVVGGAGLDMAGALALEAASYATLLGTRDRLEGLAAFAQKRAPVWRGE
jgi:methylglutaconyl-CoA hydratase